MYYGAGIAKIHIWNHQESQYCFALGFLDSPCAHLAGAQTLRELEERSKGRGEGVRRRREDYLHSFHPPSFLLQSSCCVAAARLGHRRPYSGSSIPEPKSYLFLFRGA